MNKPIKPNITIPGSFALNGVKTDFDDEKLANGFDNLQPDVLAGDNLNKFIDDTYQGLNYGMAAADAINLINEGETLTVVDGKLTSGASGGGLEIGDIGIAPLGIDETKGKRRYLNGQVIIQDQYVQFTNKVKSAVALYPSLVCTESEWQTNVTMSVYGQCGKFVVDDEAGTLRLPKITGFIQGLVDLSSLSDLVNAGLPTLTTNSTGTHTHTRGTMNITGAFDESDRGQGASGAFYVGAKNATARGDNNGSAGYWCQFDASRTWTGSTSSAGEHSHTIAGTSNTVQPEAVKYPYFIQVATGTETEADIINELELNNPFSLLDYKYSEYELNNISWLRSQGQYNSKAVYPAVYDLLLKIYNGTEIKAGVSVKLSTEAFADYDFVLNTAEETFRLPISVNNSAQGYLYFYVGETVQNANLINAGRIEEKISDIKAELPHKLDDTQITNCLLEVPQNIKLELVDGQVVLKAGSKVIIPNGSGVFEEDTILNDCATNISTGTNQAVIIYRRSVSGLRYYTLGLNVFSGSTAPTVTVEANLWYDTAENKVKITADTGATWYEYGDSFPICIATRVDGVVTSIDQVFNGFGYIGSTVWVDKGVKGLIPNGRNEDGTLNNIEITTSKVFTQTATWEADNIIFSITSDGIGRWGGSDVYYNEYYNFNYFKGSKISYCFIGTFAYSNGITSFQPKQPFRAVDYNDKPEISGWGMPSGKYIDLTLGASSTDYTAPANGYFRILGATTGFCYLRNLDCEIVSCTDRSGILRLYVPIKKGSKARVDYTGTMSEISFCFIYAEGEV